MRRLIESMGASRFIMLKNTHFDFVFGFRNILRVVNPFWVFLFKFIGSFFRLPINPYLEDLDTNFDEFSERHGNDHVVDQGNREGESSAMAASMSSCLGKVLVDSLKNQ
ncbi:hypothetical protein HRI_004139300 [Hibiscus trionum]|uniref:Uncharacterized protein n=1 Tax=Hibiscus trionum TaxID=183268 RepID=A0A9W7IXY1_HIBTR|nr:hypothetical protein HRI_004139300 [Hibiscus trionum]